MVGEVTKGLVTLETVKVKLVPPFTIEFKFIRNDVAEVIEHENRIPDVVKEQTPDVVSIEAWLGNVMIMYEPEINRLTDKNHNSYVVTLPIFGT